MERAWSVEDLVGGLWRMGRTDSDTQLQEYLRRVPSGQWPAQGQQTPEQFQQAQAAAYAQAAQAQAAGMQQAMQAMAAGKAGELVHDRRQNMQRVASLDMLRALVMQGQAPPPGQMPPQVQMAPPPGASAMNAPPARDLNAQKVHGGGAVGGRGGGRGGKASQGGQQMQGDKNADKTELRRVRRMLSNRESARRSRRRKQEHLQTLEEKIKGCENHRMQLEERVKSLIVSNKELLEENNKLREALKRANGSTFSPPPAPKDAKESPSASSPPKDAKTETPPPPAAKKEPAQQQQQQQQNEGENASPNANVKQEEAKEESPRGEKRKVKSESMKRKASFEELSKRFKSENDAGVCTIQNSGRESWNDLSAGAEKVH